jgi:ABC-2 type transport system permease protein
VSTSTDAAVFGDTLPPVRSKGISAFARDTALITHRHLLRTWRTPALLVMSALIPVMFVLLFRYVFGGSIHVPGYASYADYLIPGILVQTVLFGGSSTAVGLADDLSRGITDRFRSLPTHRSAILAARTFADLIRLSYTVALLIGIGYLVGFRFHNSVPRVAAGIAIALLFGYACCWTFALLALWIRQPETATLGAFIITFPFVFAASTFTSTSTMPSALRVFAEAQPVTRVVNALRTLTVGSTWPERQVLYALAWSLGILLVSSVLATWRFRKG